MVFDLDHTLIDHTGVEAEVWTRTVSLIRAAIPEVAGDELRRRHPYGWGASRAATTSECRRAAA